jgi:hypothetical protein
MRESGLPYDPPRDYAKINPAFATRVAKAYEDMPHAPDDPAVKASYEALARETMAQWQHVKDTGLKVDWITPQTGDPYADNPRAAIKDVRDNNHWWGYPTDLGYGSGDEVGEAAKNPMLADSGEEVSGHRARVNDIFRIVHDYFGHAKEGHGFRAEGEDNAFRSHAAMYSDAAKPAMTSELRGQNSWLNYGPHGEHNRTAKAADTIFADQKIGVMPEWAWRPTPPQAAGRAPTGLMGQEEAAMRQREGFEPPGEWTGGRVGFQDGGPIDAEWGMGDEIGELRSVQRAQARGGWGFKAGESKPAGGFQGYDRTTYHIAPTDIPASWGKIDRGRGRVEFYDPEHAHEEDGRARPNNQSEWNAAIPDKQEPGTLYRGMSWEEYQNAMKSGQIASKGDWNIGDAQKGLTMWSSDPVQARSYANDFAPWQYKATPTRPAVIAAIRDPGENEHVYTVPNEPREIGLRNPVPTSEISHVFVGRPVIASSGQMDVRTHEGGGMEEGSGASPSSYVRWSREAPMSTPMTAPQATDRPPIGLMGQEEAAMRQREGFEPPGEWTGGRISMADGGALEPVEGNPFDLQPPDRTIHPSDLARAKGFPEPRSPMHDRIAAASQDIPYTPEDIDQPGPMTETLAHYAGNPEHAMPMRIGAAIGEEGRRIGQGLWNVGTVAGDVASGKATMEDPETQQRVIGLAASLPGGGPEAALGARGPIGGAAKAARVRALAKEAPEATTTYEPPWAGEPAATTMEKNAEPETRGSNAQPVTRWNAATGQWEGPKPKMNPPEGVTYPPLFNFDKSVMDKVPDVPQFDLQRYVPPRGVSERMQDLVTNPEVRQQMLDIVRNGMQTVGMSWYNTGQLRAMFLKELGDTEGQQAFEKYMNLVSATSPENKIPQNIRTASYFYEREKQGVPPPEKGDPIAQPYGSKAQKLHQQNVNNVLTEGYDVLKNPKPPSFVQNLMGNYAPGTMDRHAFKLPAILSRDPRFLETSFVPEKGAESVRPQQMFRNGELTMDDAVNQPTMWAGMPNPNEYAALEGYYKSIADELGITPAQVQASAWVGGGHVTGLASAADETFLHSFQGRVFNTAHHTGQTPAEVVRKMIRGEQPLLSGGPGMAPRPEQDQARKEAQTSTGGAEGSSPPPAAR